MLVAASILVSALVLWGSGYVFWRLAASPSPTRFMLAVLPFENLTGDPESESQLWGEQYERDALDLLTLQHEVAEAITRQITTSLGVARSNVFADARRHSGSAEAYEHYLRGRHHVWRRDSAEGFEKAREHFRRAIDLDDSYAHAYSGLADTYTMLGTAGFLPMKDAYTLARAAALKAIALDGKLAEAHTSLAFILADYDWDWDTADRHFRSAVELNPNYETAAPGTRERLAAALPGGRRVAWARRSESRPNAARKVDHLRV